MTTNHVAAFNDLVREAAAAQDLFDNWDEGATVTQWGRIPCTLEQLTREWREANIAVIRYAQEHGDEIILEEANG